MADSVGSAGQAVEDAAIDALGLRDAVDAALREARDSGLPGLLGGPADAYRHLIIVGEIVRRYGPVLGPPLAAMHEALNRVTGQSRANEDMDTRNNSVATDAPEFRTWQDVVAWARGKIVEAAPHDGDGQEGRAFWYEKQPADWRPDFANVPITPIERGGPEGRYDADEANAAPDAPSPPASTRADPLDRPVGSWTEEDVGTVLNSPAYLRPRHPRRGEAARNVRAWFERRFGTGSVPVDATGRAVPNARAAAGRAGACPVAVRAHSRQGGKVEVGAHCRSIPAA